jgi:hypothetical protein
MTLFIVLVRTITASVSSLAVLSEGADSPIRCVLPLADSCFVAPIRLQIAPCNCGIVNVVVKNIIGLINLFFCPICPLRLRRARTVAILGFQLDSTARWLLLFVLICRVVGGLSYSEMRKCCRVLRSARQATIEYSCQIFYAWGRSSDRAKNNDFVVRFPQDVSVKGWYD